MSGKPNDELDLVIAETKRESIPADALEASARRVWERLEAAGADSAPSPACLEMRAALPALRQGRLSPARQLIVEDHLRECASCRACAAGAQDPVAAAAAWRIERPARSVSRGPARYAWAAAAVIAVAVVVWFAGNRYVIGPRGDRVRIVSIDGSAYSVSPTSEAALRPGDVVGQGFSIRTGAGSRAVVMLGDGSHVELNARTEFTIDASLRNTTLHLAQGDVIVQAPHRRIGHLFVDTSDCRVSDQGTIFAVESGLKGSRVAVIEGSVTVDHGGAASVLLPGESVATSQSVSPEPVSSQISWSADHQRYVALLDEFSRLRTKFESIPSPRPRYQSRILTLVPSDTVLYFTLPNLGDTLAQANRIFQQELTESDVLRNWWSGITGASGQATVQDMIARIQTLSSYLGDEVVLDASRVGGHSMQAPLLLAPIARPGLADFLRHEVASSAMGRGTDNGMRVVDAQSLAALPASTHSPIILVRPDFVVIGGVDQVRRMNARIDAGASGFVDTDFGKQVQAVYSQGAQFLFAANLQAIVEQAAHTQDERSGRRAGRESRHAENHGAIVGESGFGDIKYLIVTHGDVSGQTENRAMLDFGRERRGFASWLGTPSAMGSLNFVSANAGAVVSIVTKQPAQMLDDVLQLVSTQDSDAKQKLAAQQAKFGLDLRTDLAEALGGEVTFALDGPVLPSPAWKLIVEVNDPGRLQQTLATLAQRVNAQEKGASGPLLTLTQEQQNGRTFYAVRSRNGGAFSELDYTFADGYLVAAPSRALVMAALTTQAHGDSLASSGAFRALLPRDGHTNLSGLLYQNLGPVIQPLLGQFGGQEGGLVQHLVGDVRPAAICAYGESDRIEVATTANLLDLQPSAFTLLNMLGVHGSGTFGKQKP